jgi:hypothetical protein
LTAHDKLEKKLIKKKDPFINGLKSYKAAFIQVLTKPELRGFAPIGMGALPIC